MFFTRSKNRSTLNLRSKSYATKYRILSSAEILSVDPDPSSEMLWSKSLRWILHRMDLQSQHATPLPSPSPDPAIFHERGNYPL